MELVKLLTSFFLSYPFAGILKRVPDAKPAWKNIFIIRFVLNQIDDPPELKIYSIALFYLVGLFDLWVGIRTILISSIGAYLIAKYIDGPYMPWIGFVFLMGHMSVSHLHRQLVNQPSRVDITGGALSPEDATS